MKKEFSINSRVTKRYIGIHAGLVLAAVLFPLYQWLTSRLSLPFFKGCFLHDFLHVYCSFCGGTRSVDALLHFDFALAFQYNALIPLLLIVFIGLDIVALVRLLRGEEILFPLPKWSWIFGIVVLVGYAILRNYLMIARGYDPVGDLGVFWLR
jgi:hypothetical protein